MSEAVMFYILAAIAAGGAVGCAVAANIVRMALSLLATLGAVALLYFLMGADFLGTIQLIVYAGGTLVVIVFGIMLTSSGPGARFRPRRSEMAAGLVISTGLLAGLTAIALRTDWPHASAAADASVRHLANQLLSTYLVPFELVSVVLLAVMIGAAYLARPLSRRRAGNGEA
jgi:NADH:ubiquinone oxidoreductase subunit 6 (subunit J)